MIVCHKYKFIFLKTNKTAGTSVEIALSKFCDEGDIVTRLSEEEEVLRADMGGFESRRYLAPWTLYNPRDWYYRIFHGLHKRLYYSHIPARKLKNRLDPAIWDNYYKFCVERNPWDRVISQYYWRCRDLPENKWPSIDEFLNSTHVRSLRRKGFQLYTINGEVRVDKICRYENLAEDLEEVRQRLGLPEPLELPKTKATFRSDRRHYREVLTPAQRDRIAKLFAKEIRLLGYEF